MAGKVSKDMIIADLLQIDPNIASNSDACWYALYRMSVFTGGISGRGGYGAWTGCGYAG